MSRISWTDERKAAVRVLHNLGTPTEDIGQRFGVTKNAIIGLLHRMGFSTPKAKPAGDTPRRPPRPAQPALPPAEPVPAETGPSAPTEIEEEDEAIAEDDGGEIRQRVPAAAPEGCKWPMWPHADRPNHVYCNKAPAAFGVPYCAGHMAMAYVPLPRRRRSLDGLADYVTGQWAKRRQA